MSLRKEKHVKTIGLLMLVGMAFAAMIASAAGSPAAATQRVAITSKLFPHKTFVLTALKAGAVQHDSGTVLVVSGTSRQVMRDGQKVSIYARGIFTFTGKRGTITLRETTEWVDVSNVNTSYGYPPAVGIGTWKVVRGTGQYAGVTGGGRSGHAGFGSPWLARHEGFLTTP